MEAMTLWRIAAGLRRAMPMGFIAAGCLVLALFSNLGAMQDAPVREENAKAISKPATTESADIDEAQKLILELETQLEAQRVQAQKMVATLRRARAVFSGLKARETGSSEIRNLPIDKPWNSFDPMRNETLSKQALAEKTVWAWPIETATPQACAERIGGGYDARIVPAERPTDVPMVQFTKDGVEIVSWQAHSASVFLRGGDILYYAEFSPHSNGCRIVAYHFRHGELWKTPLWGVGNLSHSMYANKVNMRLDGNDLIVFGDESAGRYIEILDAQNGRIVGHRRDPQVRSITAPE